MLALAASANIRGSVMEGFAGHLIMTTGRKSAGRTSAIVRVAAGVMAPEARTVTLFTGLDSSLVGIWARAGVTASTGPLNMTI